MKVKVVMPKWGTGMNEGTILKWLKGVGERVEMGQPLVEIETAKAVQALDAPITGVLSEILLAEGQEAKVRTPIAIIEST
jgi:pyruvate dehydrogenase E2 component (dihydrolipoamide acetyltransferase)/2-oxoglutarate dehydrogenase E2 component (dihydrolipoamide succinyltransferase)